MPMLAITLTRLQPHLNQNALQELTNQIPVRRPVYMQMQVTMSMPLELTLKLLVLQEPTNHPLVNLVV